MEANLRRRVEEAFHRALELPPDERIAYLEALDPPVREEVERILEYDDSQAIDQTADLRPGAGAAPEVPAPDPLERPPGTLVGGHYELEGLLGRGGMGEVYLATDQRLGRKIALKFLSPSLAADSNHRKRFLAEARAASALNHPNVCIIHEVGEAEDGSPYMALEFLEGRSLADQIGSEQVSIDRVIDLARQMVDALDVAHSEGLVHRDIKPTNIHVTSRGQLKVLDFGLAKRVDGGGAIDSESMTDPGTILGTPLYMSPEQALGQKIDSRSDLFSVGVVLYELVTGRRPFEGENFAEVVSRIVHTKPDAIARYNYETPAELERIILKCLEKNPEERYSSARDLLVDLKRLERDVDGNAVGQTAVRAASPVSPAPVVELPDPEELKESDIFISYASVDDQSITPERQGWISQFHRNLEVRIEQLSGERVKIWRYPSPAESQALEPAFLESLSEVKTLVSVVSPPFVRSKACCSQVESFWDSAERSGNLRLPSGSRIFKVMKRPVDDGDLPPRLSELFSQLLDFEFFEIDETSGRLKEFDDAFGEDMVQLYHERVYDLAWQIGQVLRELKETGGDRVLVDDQRTVYLATATSELEARRDQLRRELVARGHVVLPDRPLPLVGEELTATVARYLEQADFSIHPVGGMYGVVPEGSDTSILEVQNRVASELTAKGRLERFIWIPTDVEVRDSRQERWIEALRLDPAEHRGADVIEGSLESLRDVFLEALARDRDRGANEDSERAESSPPRLYLICDPKDESDIETLEDFFYENGIEVATPAFDVDEAEAQRVHIQHLTEADAVLVYYGAGGKHWVDFNVRDIAKAAGYRSDPSIDVSAVYIAPPFDRRKERYRSLSTEVLRQEGSFDPPSAR